MKIPTSLTGTATELQLDRIYMSVVQHHRLSVAALVRHVAGLERDVDSNSAEFQAAWNAWSVGIFAICEGQWRRGSAVLQTSHLPADRTVENVFVVHPWAV